MFIIIITITILLFLVTSISSILSLKDQNGRKDRTGVLFLLSSALLLAAGIIRFFPSPGFSPEKASIVFEIVSGIWGYFYILSLLLVLIVIYIKFSQWKRQWKSVLAFSAPFITIILLISIPFLHSSRKIMIELHNKWLATHLVPVHIILNLTAELFFFMSFIGSIIYLFMEWQLNKKKSIKFIHQLPSLESIDRFNKWTITRALILISAGILIGMIMLYVNYRTLSLGTAKEMHIYFSWAMMFVLFIIRRVMKMETHKASILNIALFVLVMFLFIFTNIFITKGFHSFI